MSGDFRVTAERRCYLAGTEIHNVGAFRVEVEAGKPTVVMIRTLLRRLEISGKTAKLADVEPVERDYGVFRVREDDGTLRGWLCGVEIPGLVSYSVADKKGYPELEFRVQVKTVDIDGYTSMGLS